jgi:hypothetical protein
MDAMVLAALAKWPNVPACRGWLGLDARGDWYMRDDACQAAGAFPHPKGSQVLHDKLREFIHRNYEADADGAWFFQNGPQRVYVELESSPYIWRLSGLEGALGGVQVQAHTGVTAGQVQGCWLDEAGRLYLSTSLGFGLVHSLDTGLAAEEIEAGRWPAWQPVLATDLPRRFGFVASPVGHEKAASKGG